jgi:eukaryotic-like serine/threonine-protein kinase
LVRRSKLVDADSLPAAITAAEAEGVLTAEALASALVARGLLTEWQAQKLLVRRYKGFFLGRYKLLEQIGAGGMSRVFLAEHTLLRQRRAIKVLPRERVADSTYLARFHLEAQATAALDDPHIVRAYDVDHVGDIHFLVMEFVPGKNLQTLVSEQGPLGFQQAANYISQAARGLAHAHDVGLIHRDVKPGNLLVDPRGIVKLLDLGLALFSEGQGSLTMAHDEHVLGTADYLAPEQAMNSHRVDGRADIYSLGCTLYFALTGSPPFPQGTLAQRIVAHQAQAPAAVKSLRPDCPDELLEICQRMMAKDPRRRYQSAREVAEALESWLLAHAPVPAQAGNFSNVSNSRENAPPRIIPITRTPRRSTDTVSSRDQETKKGLPKLSEIHASTEASATDTAQRKAALKKLAAALLLLLALLGGSWLAWQLLF